VSASTARAAGLGVELPAAPAELVGRAREMAVLGALLRDPGVRLVTLTGPPGVGKTALAVAAAGAGEDAFPDGVAVVDLTAVRDPDLVPAEIAGLLGGRPGSLPADDLARALADRRMLLVLDNFEHLLPAAGQLGELVAALPQVTVLVTSRERLRLRAERELPVPPLVLPGPAERLAPERVADSPAVALLVRAVQRFDPGFTVTAANAEVLAEICTRLDGLPLALELAAARLRLFDPAELLTRLRSRMTVLASDARDVPDRHRTLSAALAWSHDLLDPRERTLFRRLSVFVGSWTLEAAAAVCHHGQGNEERDDDTVTTTASLVDKSLVRRAPGGAAPTRFTMLESLREFAADQLERSGDAGGTRARHADHFVAYAVGIERRVGTAEEGTSIEDVGLDVGNLRAAAAHLAAAGQPGRALTPATALGWYSYTRGRLGSGQVELESAIAAAAGDPGTSEESLAGALLLVGALSLARGQVDEAEHALARGLGLNEQVRSPRLEAIGQAFLGHAARTRGRVTEAVAHYEEAGRRHEELGNLPGIAWSRYDLGLLARRSRDPDRAASLLRESLASFRELGYPWAVGCAAHALATVELTRRRPDEAAALVEESLECFEATDDRRGVAQALEAAAAVALEKGDPRAAGTLLGAAGGLRARLAAPPAPEEAGSRGQVAGRVREVLGSDAADSAARSGRGLPPSSAVALARRLLPRRDPVAGTAPAGPLTAREHQVAVLVRHGRTNRQIGRQLGIAEKTAEVHVHNIIRKLGASSRAEVAAWVAAGTGVGPADGDYGIPLIPPQARRP
jgi:predicted ATPase/DNA-binding CsgD family transcriptional regulator